MPVPWLPLAPLAAEKAAHKVMSSGEVSLAICTTQESRAETSSGQYSRANTGGRGPDDPVLKVRVWESWPCHLSTRGGRVWELMPPLPLLPGAVGRTGPEILRVGELSLPLTVCRTQESEPCTSSG